MISLIVAIDEHNAIGRNGDLLCHLSDDLKHFKALTTGHTVVMGKRTFLGLPRHPLPNRRNIVLTSQSDFCFENTEVAHSIDQVQQMVKDEHETFIIGGGQVYEQFLPLADQLYVTHIAHTWDDADTFFPFIDPKVWQCTSREEHAADEHNPYPFAFAEYTKETSSMNYNNETC